MEILMRVTFLRGTKAPLVKGSWRGGPEGLARRSEKAPLSGADSPYQGEMSRRDKRGRDAGSRRLTERLSQICYDLSVSAFAEPPPLEGEALGLRTPKASPMRCESIVETEKR